MKPGVLRFTPHVQSVESRWLDDPDLNAFLNRVDVVVYATGAEGVLDQASPNGSKRSSTGMCLIRMRCSVNSCPSSSDCAPACL